MSTIVMHRVFLKHEGGSKFYQTFRIVRGEYGKPATHACSIVHHGPVRSIRISDPRPITGGNSIIYPGGSKADDQIRAKIKGGYYKHEEDNQVFESVEKAGEAFTRWFGARRRDEIFLKLGLSVTGEDVEAELDPSAHVEDTPIEPTDPFKDRPAAWGSW